MLTGHFPTVVPEMRGEDDQDQLADEVDLFSQPKRSPTALPVPPPIQLGTMQQKRFFHWLFAQLVECIKFCVKK